ncbi:Vacuolar protein sorting-associated protein atg6 [Clarireedia jacksonii]
MEQNSSSSEVCAYCHDNSAKTLKCGGCSSQLGNEKHASIYYCRKACQTAHWNIHKQACKIRQTRQLLYRAASVLQDIFYSYREAVFELNIVKIEEKDGVLYLYEGKYADIKSVESILHKFPEGLEITEEDRKSALSFMACSDVMLYMNGIITHFLKGVVSEITELCFIVKNARRLTKAVTHTGVIDHIAYPHSVLKVTLKHGGGEYVLDLTCAQHGYLTPVVPFTAYSDLRIERVISCQEFGDAKGAYLTFAAMLPGGYEHSLVNENVHVALSEATNEWENLKGMKVLTLLKLPGDEFEQKQKTLLDFVKGSVENSRDYFMKMNKALGSIKASGGIVINSDEI